MIKKGKRLVSISILLIICVAFFMAFNQNRVEASKSIQEKVDIGEYNIYVNCFGKGRPTVIFESGLGLTNDCWESVQSEIAKVARTFSYDRAGLGKSDKFKTQMTSAEQVKVLHELLKKTNVKGPYIIVAHSIGGYNARLFADMYPDEVKGIVFVDSSHENQTEFLIKKLTENQIWIYKRMFKNGEMSYDQLMQSGQLVKEARAKDALRNMPIIVLTAERDNRADANEFFKLINSHWMEWQKEITALSDKSVHKVIADTGHIIQQDQPQAVIDAINEMFDMIN